MLPSPLHFGVATVAAVAVSAMAWRAGALTARGAVAAAVVGTVAMAGGLPWGLYLIAWFVAAAGVARIGRVAKALRLARIVDKPGARDARQVLANGLVFTLCAVCGWLWPDARWAVAAAAALAAAGADTWATEIGTWYRADAWSVRAGRRVPTGTSGAVTPLGTAALLAGAGVYAAIATGVGLVAAGAWLAVAYGAVAGALADTLLGAWVQERRSCEACGMPTEQRRHACGAVTRHIGGVRGIDNDVVNLAATVIGAAWALFFV